MAEVGYATLGIIPSFDGFERNLTKGTSGAMTSAGRTGGTQFGEQAGRSAGSRFGNVFGKAAKAALVGAAALGVGAIKVASDSIAAASDLAESTNKVEQVFGRGSERIFKFTERAADAFGQTNTAAREAAATFGIFGRVAGMTDKKNAKFAIRMTKLGSDLASFNNTSPEQAIEALGAALRGESEPIRAYGVLLDEATLKAEAMRIGLLKPVKDAAKIKAYQVAILEGQQNYNEAVKEHGKESLEALKAEANLGTARDRLKKATEGTIPPLTQQQKVMAAQSSIMQQTKIQQGDFARTSDGLANAQRRLSARWEDAKAALGTALLPAMEDFVGFVLEKGIPAIEDFSEWFRKDGVRGLKNFADDVKGAWQEVKKLADWIGELPDSVKIGGLAGVAGAFAGGKRLGLGQQGGIMGRGGALGAPIKVFETNPAAMGGGVDGGGVGKGKSLGAFLSKGALPVAVIAWSGIALKDFFDFQSPDGSRRGVGMLGGGGFNDWWDASAAPAISDAFDSAFSKIETNFFDRGHDAIEALRTDVDRLDREASQLGPYKVGLEIPSLNPLFSKVQQFGSILDGLDGRQIQLYINARYNGPAGGLGAPNRSGTDSGEPSTRFGRTGGNTYNFNGIQDLSQVRREVEHEERRAAVGGADFR